MREFRRAVHDRVFTPIFASCVETFPLFDSRDFQLEPAAWEILRQKPLHLLESEFATWDELLVSEQSLVPPEVAFGPMPVALLDESGSPRSTLSAPRRFASSAA